MVHLFGEFLILIKFNKAGAYNVRSPYSLVILRSRSLQCPGISETAEHLMVGWERLVVLLQIPLVNEDSQTAWKFGNRPNTHPSYPKSI